ncbi:uncharacterized protein BP01DRAFT_347003 [Aspergillus saccharolyticus JOP 1030-1]|uniref:Uncharacterized protein n=1 Tax=Aspergillus saccharolyticus JOP 1030-1 TaxID=1450539 RepID=A0A318ZQQ9_9EURO|nr:hypothetical protein BP01DRAFT_347003 [Aspergillus saccharolyticus JOP 1030-1]PYH42438.1 hypothetical protein BP01DRAFT_347003 [Aspergillus saccharolyticus JOP 1030-1]
MAQPNHFDHLWNQAKVRYKSVTGHNLDSPAVPSPASADELLTLLDARNSDFLSFRDKRSVLFHNLKALCTPIELVGNVVSTGASLVFAPSSACFNALLLLIDAARGVSSFYDSIDFLARLKIYLVNQVTPELRTTLMNVLVILLEVFGRSAQVIRSGTLGRTLTFAKNALLGRDNKLQGLLDQLEKLCQSENRLVAAETWAETKRTAHQMDKVSEDLGTLVLGQATFRNEFQQEMHKVRETIAAGSAKGEMSIARLREILKPSVHPLDAYQSLAKKRVSGTADWIFAEPLFRKWMAVDGEAPLLAICGSPGCGKSVLSQHVIHQLNELQKTREGNTGSVAYFFFSNSDTETKSVSQALRDCAWQVCQVDASYQAYLEAQISSADEIKTIRSAWRTLYSQCFALAHRAHRTMILVFDGLDEAFQDDREQFFELLSDVASCSGSAIKVLLVGRPEIYAELADAIGQIPCIQVDAVKNSADIRTFIDITMQKSRVLSRIPRDLESSIRDKLMEKSQGMFLWADLMLRELSRKTRASSMLESLTKAPKGLDEMLEHVLRGFSSKLEKEEAENLNTMLAWLACSDVPLTLRQLDFILQYDSLGGDGVFDLETMLRIQYASFFLVLREDGLTTADLQGTDAAAYFLQGPASDAIISEFQSNKDTTRVVFRHASIGEYLRNPGYGKVSDVSSSMPVGVNIVEAQKHILTHCLRLFQEVSAENEDPAGRISLIIYAHNHWRKHVRQLMSQDLIDASEKREMGPLLCRALASPDTVHCLNPIHWEFFASGDFRLVERLLHDDACSDLPTDDEMCVWLKSARQTSGGLFLDLAKYGAESWLEETIWSASNCFRLVWAVKLISEGKDLEILHEIPNTETVLEVARWTKVEENALWHERVGNCLSDFGHLDEAKYHADMSLRLQPQSVGASLDIARIYLKQNKRDEAITMHLEAEALYTRLFLAKEEPEYPDSDRPIMVSPYKLASLRLTLAELYEPEDDPLESAHWLHSALQLEVFSVRVVILVERLSGKLSRAPHRNPTMIIQLLQAMDRTARDHEDTILDFCLTQDQGIHRRFFPAIATAAHATGKVDWLVNQFLRARAIGVRDLRSHVVVSLDLCLAELYSRFRDEPRKAMAIWQRILALPRVEVDRDGHWEMTHARERAESCYAYQLFMDALRDHHNTETFLHETTTQAKWLFESPLNSETFIANRAGLYLGRWFLDHGDTEQARRYFRPYVKISLAGIEEIDFKWRANRLYKLTTFLVTAEDDANSIALFHAISDAHHLSVDGLESSDDEPGRWSWYCDVCTEEYDSCASCNKCRVCAADICKNCFPSVKQGTSSSRVCAPNHAWLLIPAASTPPEPGYIMIGDDSRLIEDFLANLAQSWQ